MIPLASALSSSSARLFEVSVGFAGLDRLRQAAPERVRGPDPLGREPVHASVPSVVPDLDVDDVRATRDVRGDDGGRLLVDDDLAVLDEVRADDRVGVLGETGLGVVHGLASESRGQNGAEHDRARRPG